MFGGCSTSMSQDFDKRLDDFFRTYQDRGMKKWQGFMISDLNSAVEKFEKHDYTVYRKKKTMSEEEISELLMIAYSNHLVVSIQLKELDTNAEYSADIVGMVEGYNVDHILIDGRWVDFDSINHVEIN